MSGTIASDVEKIANAVLYEGYLLYPYRRSAIKNQQRWNFGMVYPQAQSEVQKGVDNCIQQTECIIHGSGASSVDIRVRFLQAISTRVTPESPSTFEVRSDPFSSWDASCEPSGISQAMPPQDTSFQETIEREITFSGLLLLDLVGGALLHCFSFSSACGDEATQANKIIRQSIHGTVEVRALQCGEEAFRLTILLSNATPMENLRLGREDLLQRSFLCAHVILRVNGAAFVSLTDPPAECSAEAAACHNIGTWPVLVGDEGSHDQILSSPIILYDYPRIAPESPGDLFDSTEIDEILALRILTLSDEEKCEIRQSNDRAREILDRTEMLPAETFAKLHGVLRSMNPVPNSDGPPAEGAH